MHASKEFKRCHGHEFCRRGKNLGPNMRIKHCLAVIMFWALVLGVIPWAQSMEYYWGQHPDHERIVFEFQQELPEFSAVRSARDRIGVNLPRDIWDRAQMPEPVDFETAELIREVQVQDNKLFVQLRTDEFGYITFTLPQENKIVLDIFPDPLGARWESVVEFPELEELVDEPKDPEEPVREEDVVEPEEPVLEEDPEEPEPEPTHRVRREIQRVGPQELGLVHAEQLAPDAAEELDREPGREVTDAEPRDPDPVDKEKYQELMEAAQIAMSGGEYQTAASIYEDLKRDPELPQEFMEEVLYSYAQANFQKHRGDIPANFQEVLRPFEQAINYDPTSERVPEAILNKGYTHLQVGNEPEAEGNFQYLRNNYPEHETVPATYYYLGDHYHEQGEYEQAADQFEHIVQEYPQDDLIKPSAVALTRVLNEMDLHGQALDILDFVENRWPDYHLEDPEFLVLAGNILYGNQEYDRAREKFMHYINLHPEGEEVDLAMARVGDILYQQGQEDAAHDMYEETAAQFPDAEGGLVAQMRLANRFDDETLRPKTIYSRISEEFPESELAPLALLRLAEWNRDNEFYQEAMEDIQRFEQRYDHKDIWPRARNVGVDAFKQEVTERFPDQEYDAITSTWEEYNYLRQDLDQLDRDTRLALATAYWEEDQPEESLDLAEPFLDMEEIDEHNIAALSLILTILLDTGDWPAILDLAEQVQGWDLPEDKRLQLDYAHALALQNQGREDEARPLWQDLAVDTDLPEEQRAHALFFMAEHSMQREDYENAYVFAQESLALFREQEEKNVPRIRTNLEFLMDATAITGRHTEALSWALEFEDYIDEDDPEWPAFRYRLANLYRLNDDHEQWERILQELRDQYPEDLHGRMAELDLEGQVLDREMDRFRP